MTKLRPEPPVMRTSPLKLFSFSVPPLGNGRFLSTVSVCFCASAVAGSKTTASAKMKCVIVGYFMAGLDGLAAGHVAPYDASHLMSYRRVLPGAVVACLCTALAGPLS